MKKSVLLLLAFMPVWLFAGNISENRALSIAENFFNSSKRFSGNSPSYSLRMVWNGESNNSRDVSDPAFYVYNNESGKGFVIVSGDDRTSSSIIAYSFENNFDAEAMPENLNLWLDGIRGEINDARAKGISSYNKKLTRYGNNDKQPIKQLNTPLWDQRAPFSNKLPLGYVTGCPATAIAIIMRYHQWPDKGVGTIPASNDQIGDVKLGHVYDWANMPYGYTGANDYQKDQVATLMRDVGAMVRTQYGQGSAGANPEETLPQVMPIYMRYDAKSIKSVFKKNFSDEEWHAMMRKELDENRPILYGGYSSGGGHQFVIDGYATNDFYHVNWGWSGVSNGYYLLTTMNPPEQGAGGSSSADGFTKKQDAIIGIKPDLNNPGGGHFDLIAYKPIFKDKPFGMMSNVTEYSQGGEFQVDFKEFQNKGSRAFPGKLAIAHYAADGSFKGIISKKEIDYSRYPQQIHDFTEAYIKCVISQPIEPGDYICGVYKYLNPADWTPIRNGYLDRTDCIDKIVIKEPLVAHNVEIIVGVGGQVEINENSYRDGRFYVEINDGESLSVSVIPDQGANIASVIFNDENVTSKLVNGIFQSGPINADASLNFMFGCMTDIDNVNNDELMVVGDNNCITISGLKDPAFISVYTINGVKVSSFMSDSSNVQIPLADNKFYLVRVGDKVFKIVL